MLAPRAGLVIDPGSKVTYNGAEIGRVSSISETQRDGVPAAKFVLEVNPRYVKLIPANVDAKIKATTVFGNKYVALTSAQKPYTATHHTAAGARCEVGDDRVQHVVRDA